MAIKPVKIKIITTTVDLMHKNSMTLSVDGDIEDELLEEFFGDDELDGRPVVFETEGVMSLEKGLIKIIYDEAAMVGLGRAETVFAFNTDTPTTVSMFKSGNLNAALVFDSVPTGACIAVTYLVVFMVFSTFSYIKKKVK